MTPKEYKVLKVMVRQAWSETEGEFGCTDHIRVSNLSKHEVAGYISALKKRDILKFLKLMEFITLISFILKRKLRKYLIM